MRRLLALVIVLLATSVAAQSVPDEMVTATALVPIVGSTPGINNVRWQTDVELINDTGTEAIVALELPTSTEALAMIIALAPGQTQRFANVVGDAFGLDMALSPC